MLFRSNEDGTGYPHKFTGDDLHMFCKIVHVCDVYDALVTNRVYRKAMNPADAFEYLMSNCWTMFDASCVKRLMQSVSPYPTGVTVELSNGKMGIVSQQNREAPARPQIVLTETGETLDLAKILNITIIQIIT